MSAQRMFLVMLLTAALAVASAPFAAFAAEANSNASSQASAAIKPLRTGYVDANGLKYHYRIYGRGEPLVLLHGGLLHGEVFGPVISKLARHRQVITVDLHGHGRTALGERQISFTDMGDDIAKIASALGHKQVDVLGYSIGGGVALRLAIQHPGMVRKLVVVAAPYAQDGWHTEMLPMQASLNASMAESMKGSPLHETYVAVAPRPQDFPRLLDQMGNLMREVYDWSEDVKKLKMPVMLVYGDGDMVRPDHIVRFYQLLGGGLRDAGWQREHMSTNRLAIIPDMTHYEMMSSPVMAATVLPFLQHRTASKSN